MTGGVLMDGSRDVRTGECLQGYAWQLRAEIASVQSHIRQGDPETDQSVLLRAYLDKLRDELGDVERQRAAAPHAALGLWVG